MGNTCVSAFLLALTVIAPFVASQGPPAACVCAREDEFLEDHASGTCGGGIRCFVATQENLVPVPEGEENGVCKTLVVPCSNQTQKPCRFDQYSIRVTASTCAVSCMHGDSSADVAIDHPWTTMNAQTLNPGGYVSFSFAGVPDFDCGTGPKSIVLTVSAGGQTVFEVRRRVKCNKCPATS